jgi:hypothetical protein
MAISQQPSVKRNVARARGCAVAYLTGAILCAQLFGVGDARSAASTQARHVNAGRLQGTLEKLSDFGRNPEGGVTRLGFSQTELEARGYVKGLMKEAGLELRVDPAGNVFGRRLGTDKLPTLLFGSHITPPGHPFASTPMPASP